MPFVPVRVEVLAVGTELLLGQIIDTNSTWIGEALAAGGIDSHFQTRVGDNRDRIVLALRSALARSDAVIVCGGLGPTPDDITREAVAEVMNVDLVHDEEVMERIRSQFGARHREMSANNANQALVPLGATVIPQVMGTAPGLRCPVGHKVVYAVPGVPDEMREMVARAVIPDLQSRAGQRAVILSRTLRTWGMSESGLAEMLAPRVTALDQSAVGEGSLTIAFLASGIEGIKVRLTVKAPDEASARSMLDGEEREVRSLLGSAVFGTDDQTMEHAVARALLQRGLTLGLAESVTGGLVASRLVAIPGASTWFRGAVVAYDADVKHRLLDVPQGPLVSQKTALAMAEGARRVLESDVGLATTGVAGPHEHDGMPVGVVWCGVAGPGERGEAVVLRLPGDRDRVRQLAAIALLDRLRLHLVG